MGAEPKYDLQSTIASLDEVLAKADVSFLESLGLYKPAPSGRKLVLIVDDDEFIREFLAHIIEKEGFQVDTANDGAQALKKIEGRRPDLMILDLMMPNQGGFETLRGLQNSETSGIPILVITARQVDHTTESMIRGEPNVAGLIAKPFNPAALLSKVHEIALAKSSAGLAAAL